MTWCRNVEHRKNAKGKCQTCINDGKRAKRAVARQARLAGLPARTDISVSQQLRLATCYEKYGASGVSPALRAASIRTINRHRYRKPLALRCKRGHLLSGRNLYWYRGQRKCVACVRVRSRKRRSAIARPVWVEVKGGGRVSIAAHDAAHSREKRRLKQAMIRSHPDHGGSLKRLEKARKALLRFMEAERQWYDQFDIVPPGRAAKLEE